MTYKNTIPLFDLDKFTADTATPEYTTDPKEKVKDRKQKERIRGKHYYANNHGFDEQNNEFPSEYADKIVCGDSRVVLERLPDNCVDLILTSPPYNFGLEYDSTDDAISWDEYFESLFSIFDECIRVLKYGGRIVVNIQPVFSDYVPTHHIISQYFMRKKLIWKAEILWEKNHFNQYTAWGSWKSPSNPYLKCTWEFLEVFCKGTTKHDGDPDKADIDADSFKEWVTAKWVIQPERNMQRYDHPAMFPEELATRVLKLLSFQDDVILDPFNGTGTTCLSAFKHQRAYLGIDISDTYCRVAEDRLRLLL